MRFDDPDDPAMKPVYEAGGGESEGFEAAEDELVEHASHGDWGGTARINEHGGHVDEEREPDEDQYGEADEIDPSEHEDPEPGA
jgi:hypothetical protein